MERYIQIFLAALLGALIAIYLMLSAPTGSCTVPAVAVTSSGEGMVAHVSVKVEPGQGNVYISVTPKVAEDTQESAEIAAYLAKQLAGVIQPLDFYFSIVAPSEFVEGPSAGAAMVTAAYCAITGKKPRNDAVVTGMVEWNGEIGPVGGLLGKLQAAADAGFKYFLIPEGEMIVRVVKRERRVYRAGPMVIVENVPVVEEVNLAEVGEKLGVKVIEVRNVEELIKFMFGASGQGSS